MTKVKEDRNNSLFFVFRDSLQKKQESEKKNSTPNIHSSLLGIMFKRAGKTMRRMINAKNRQPDDIQNNKVSILS